MINKKKIDEMFDEISHHHEYCDVNFISIGKDCNSDYCDFETNRKFIHKTITEVVNELKMPNKGNDTFKRIVNEYIEDRFKELGFDK